MNTHAHIHKQSCCVFNNKNVTTKQNVTRGGVIKSTNKKMPLCLQSFSRLDLSVMLYMMLGLLHTFKNLKLRMVISEAHEFRTSLVANYMLIGLIETH